MRGLLAAGMGSPAGAGCAAGWHLSGCLARRSNVHHLTYDHVRLSSPLNWWACAGSAMHACMAWLNRAEAREDF